MPIISSVTFWWSLAGIAFDSRRCLNSAAAFLLPRALPPILLSFQSGGADVATGTLKWFNPTKGSGFIQPDGGGKDVFVHISAVEKAGLGTRNESADVSYATRRRKTAAQSAENLKVG